MDGMMKNVPVLLILMLVPTFLSADFVVSAGAGGGVEVANAWVRFSPPAMKVHGAYLMITNKTDSSLVLESVSSPVYDKVELHQSKITNGVARMEKLDKVTIDAGKMVHFEPGGMHLMLFEPKEKHSLGAKVPLVLKFADGHEVFVEAMVASGMGGEMKTMGHEQHRGSH